MKQAVENNASRIQQDDHEDTEVAFNAGVRLMKNLAKLSESMNRRPDDYLGKDGLYHCAKCHGQKQRLIKTDLQGVGMVKVWCMCPCKAEEERKARKAKQQEEERIERQKERAALAGRLKDEYMRDEMLRTASFDIFFSEVFTGIFDNEDSRRIYKIATRYVNLFDRFYSENRGMIFFGPTGTGKTFTAACIANALLNKGIPVVMTSLPRLTDSIVFGDETKSATAIIERFNRADLLIIDDLGVERLSSFAQEKSYEFINGRYEAKKPILITTNLTAEELMNTQNIEMRRLYERINESSYTVDFPLTNGLSLRRKQARDTFSLMQELLEGD